MTQELTGLITKIDNLITHNMRYYYKKTRRRQIGYFDGMVEASYQFAYYIIDADATIQDAIDMLNDDMHWYSNPNRTKITPFDKGYVHGIRTLLDCLARFKEAYEIDTDGYIKHVYSVIYLDEFDTI